MRIKLTTGNGAAWRALYLKLGSTQVARITIDPTASRGPTMTLGLPWVRCSADTQHLSVRLHFTVKALNFVLPHVTWARAATGPVWLAAYKLSQKFWHGMDGRYGWRGSCRRA